MEIKHTDPSRFFVATSGGVGLDFDRLCAHGTPAVSFHLFSETAGTSEDLGVVLPSCVAARLFGSALAFIKVSGGSAAADEFVKDMLESCDATVPRLTAHAAEHAAAQRACCQAAHHTRGREHTCRDTTQPPA
ncbi:hypothetical protein ABZ322_44145 [Streptomyces sp. NPDC006129]|uniref:hypothetical protein n=1 Tax=Streptomyces sp. NPDC006129 TaxID=3155348 RepID=UPI0033A53C02